MGFNLFNSEDSLSCQFCKYTAYFYFIPCIQCLLIVKGGFRGGGGGLGRGGDVEAATTPFFFDILYVFSGILILYSWQLSQPPLSEFSGFAPANVCNNLRRKVDKAS